LEKSTIPFWNKILHLQGKIIAAAKAERGQEVVEEV
jgi:hypothetical protein